MLDELDQPLVADRVEKAPDVGVHDPAHVRARNAHSQRIQRLVLAALGSEPVREAQEVRLEDRVEHFHHGALDDLVFQRRNPQRPQAAV